MLRARKLLMGLVVLAVAGGQILIASPRIDAQDATPTGLPPTLNPDPKRRTRRRRGSARWDAPGQPSHPACQSRRRLSRPDQRRGGQRRERSALCHRATRPHPDHRPGWHPPARSIPRPKCAGPERLPGARGARAGLPPGLQEQRPFLRQFHRLPHQRRHLRHGVSRLGGRPERGGPGERSAAAGVRPALRQSQRGDHQVRARWLSLHCLGRRRRRRRRVRKRAGPVLTPRQAAADRRRACRWSAVRNPSR